MEYKLMNKNELTNYIFNFWSNRGININKKEISENLKSKNGIENELDTIRDEFGTTKDIESIEYLELEKLWNYLNWYKTDFYKNNKIN